ncbi:MAG: TOBE domain-containing protein [Anaerococcus sp.]|uniref:TOBE domain-containing protein n=1 Tax=Anaerococcus sp. TaxID=1872515 RepID=UPI0029125AF9|nr:TOBE domain-containing protein [Anaerococcus sp.]MDU4026395.1 TOBE domain-containing protein [Anaerococcus sp.]
MGNSFIRPEKIKISENGEEFIIKDIIFMGSTIEVFLANNNKNLKLLLLNDNFDKKIGDKIKLDYDMEQIK